MVDPVTTAVGGVLGAIIGVFWSDPFRDRKGRYTTRRRGYSSWWFQAVIGALIGSILTSFVMPLLVFNPVAGLIALAVVSYVVYFLFVDPR